MVKSSLSPISAVAYAVYHFGKADSKDYNNY